MVGSITDDRRLGSVCVNGEGSAAASCGVEIAVGQKLHR